MRAGLTVENARIDAEVLARHALGWDRARLLADGRDPMPADVGQRFSALIERRATREPVAFITGHREFWGLDFDVSPDVLIPRPETELIVEAVCERRGRRADVRTIVDVGTGQRVPRDRRWRASSRGASVLAIDISAAALVVAARNAARHRRRSTGDVCPRRPARAGPGPRRRHRLEPALRAVRRRVVARHRPVRTGGRTLLRPRRADARRSGSSRSVPIAPGRRTGSSSWSSASDRTSRCRRSRSRPAGANVEHQRGLSGHPARGGDACSPSALSSCSIA